eukprot:2091038-Pleurochrysis_carterae.AAC.2
MTGNRLADPQERQSQTSKDTRHSSTMARAGGGASSSHDLGRARPRNTPPPPRFAASRGSTGLTGTKRPLTRAWNTRDEASRLEDRRRDTPRRGAPRRDDTRREEPLRRSRTPESEDQHHSTSPAQSKKQRRSNSPTQSDADGPREREGDEGGRSRERRVGAKSKFSDHPSEEPEMSKNQPASRPHLSSNENGARLHGPEGQLAHDRACSAVQE